MHFDIFRMFNLTEFTEIHRVRVWLILACDFLFCKFFLIKFIQNCLKSRKYYSQRKNLGVIRYNRWIIHRQTDNHPPMETQYVTYGDVFILLQPHTGKIDMVRVFKDSVFLL